ncbi:AMP-dependent synthetase [Streptomyces alfalfae]|uniref:AMP-dependent synthetase n=1 Tax=Streptomyces alfalfae TaxID=1642299 RepID=A0ABN4VZ02_9ACTN|nr:AMP-binding protein [Streptomyces alfalfae]AYA20580.1 AMP-dependent synthetase [Streptomyces fradiae]APY90119.1 AMP-dependent synthetase [Streptomyces alfalfae]QUI29802.1 AMP-binding protein [Streptomyces alfalfae]RXX34786.1 AMP-dependent synthetase [Streptomyces alfalfae]RZM91563.1 AMP-dependent synthetase [Streptomyces alfalfae]
MNLGTYLTRSARHWPAHPALVCGDQTWSYDRLETAANRLASALRRRGLRPGEAVASLAWNRAELVEVEFALYKAGLIRVPVNARLGRAEIEHILRDAPVRVLVFDAAHREDALAAVEAARTDCLPVLLDTLVDEAPAAGGPVKGGAAVEGGVVDTGPADAGPGAGPRPVPYADLLAEGDDGVVAVETAEHDPAVLNFTSGSTGALKAAVQTFGNRLANMRKTLMSEDSRPGPHTRYLACGPITHATGMVLLAGVFGGATTHILPTWSAEAFFDTVERERITATFLVPAMLNMVLAHPGAAERDLSSLTSVRVGGAPVSPQRLRDAVALFGPVVAQGYGLAETTSVVAGLSSADVLRGVTEDEELLRSCGRPAYDSEVRVVDERGGELPPREIGEVIVRGPDCVSEYWHAPDLSAETFRDGWVHTGDLAFMREDGYLFLVDRKKDMIISGGFNIYSTEVETALYEHPAVQEACVIGVPDEKWGEAVKAVVVTRPGQHVGERELADFCALRLDRFKKPRSVEFVTALPHNRNGKLDRKAVREPYWAGADRRVH